MLITRTVGFPVVVHIVAGIAHMLELFISENAAESLQQHHVQQQQTMNHFRTVNQGGEYIKMIVMHIINVLRLDQIIRLQNEQSLS
jgi:hypothetical protein